MGKDQVWITKRISNGLEVIALPTQSFVDAQYRTCMECGKPANFPLPGFGVEVARRDTGELVGYLHANCKDAWMKKNGEAEFSFRTI